MNWNQREISGGTDDALMMLKLLREGGELHPFHPRLRLRQGEVAVVERPADYARYYGVEAEWTRVSSPFTFNPLRHAGHAVANNVRRQRARKEAALQWRDWHRNLVTVTNSRLLVHYDTWLSFWYEEIYELEPVFDHPRRGQYGLTASFADAPRLGLFGPYALTILFLVEYFSGRLDLLAEEPDFRQWLAELAAEDPA